MTEAQAQTAVSASALVTGAIYLYRRLVEPATPAASSKGSSPAVPPAAQVVPPASSIPTGYDFTTAEAPPAYQQILLGTGPVAPVSRFVVGWGFVYIVLALLAQSSQPGAGGWFAILIATGSVLGNGAQVSKDLNLQLLENSKVSKLSSAESLTTAPTVAVDYVGGASSSLKQPPRSSSPSNPARS